MSESTVWLDLDQLQQRLCVITAEQLGYGVDEVKPESRLIEDLHCDSLDMVELIMETEDEFGITIPESPDTPVGKLIFTRQPFRIRDLAEYAFLNQGSGSPVRAGWRKRIVESPSATEREFSQLGGRLDPCRLADNDLFEPLDLTPGYSTTGYSTFRRATDGMVCVELLQGQFTCGSDKPDDHPDEGPSHVVLVSPFLMDIEPVSVTAFCRFLNSIDASDEEVDGLVGLSKNDDRSVHMQFAKRGDRWRPNASTAMQPVVLISWFAANAYSLWANRYDWHKFQSGHSFLPSEAQWEYAAQGAFVYNAANQGLIQNTQHQRGERYETGVLPIAEVHYSLGVSDHGLRHMSGTVWHWCRDWFDSEFYKSAKSRLGDPIADVPTGIRSERGGSWVGTIELCRTSYRRGRNPQACGRCLGFRCVSHMPNQTM